MKDTESWQLRGMSLLSGEIKEQKRSPAPIEVPSFLTEDLAIFFITHFILITEPKNVNELKDFFSFSEELTSMVDLVLFRMEEANILEVEEKKIKILHDSISCNRPEDQLRFLGRLFQIAVKRVLENEIKNSQQRKQKRETVFWSILPDDEKVAKELREINCEYMAKLRAIEERCQQTGEQKNSTTCLRFNGLVNVLLKPEDFE